MNENIKFSLANFFFVSTEFKFVFKLEKSCQDVIEKSHIVVSRLA